ncbi:MAG: NADH-quinone oxidoreductase subunit L [Chloroflexi bacterium]|nr:NADH-quinone oxidoreductase subunit L [Chloroflexota bacterium]
MPNQIPWLILIIPFLSFVINALILRPFFPRQHKLAGYVTIGAIGIAFALSLWTLSAVTGSPEHKLDMESFSWLKIGNLNIEIGLLIDGLTSVMLVVVTLVSLMVQIYSQGYMHGDAGYIRYYSWMSLFTTFMLVLVTSNSLLFMYLGWEGVGLCSYLLIGFWFHGRPGAKPGDAVGLYAPANAAKKAFLVTRLGDVGFLLAILYLFSKTGTFNIEALGEAAAVKGGVLAGAAVTWAALGIFAGAAGKSAQFPLHVWLPDAMEGPTPVSALIHAATMVAAGVFLVARTMPIFMHSVEAATVVAIIGGFTAIFAASMGLVMNDIKRVIAYSTISQLGYMMVALGTGALAVAQGADAGKTQAALVGLAVTIGIFHLFNHAFFKALLFLGAGSVNHATGTFDMRLMGGLRKHLPWTSTTFLIAALSLAGIWPLAGFWSKDEILAQAWEHHRLVFFLALITVFMTAFYIFRVYFLTFGGKYRGGEAAAVHGPASIARPPSHSTVAERHEAARSHDVHPPTLHEAPGVMVAPMVVLSVLAVISGWFNLTGGFARLLGEEEAGHGIVSGLFGIFAHPLPWISLVLAGGGIFLAYAMYSKKWVSAEAVGRAFKPLYALFSHKYWLDEAYERGVVSLGLIGGFFRGLAFFDSKGVDGAVNGAAQGTAGAGRLLRRAQSGQLQLYGMAIVVGIIAVIVGVFIFGA